MTLKRRRQEPEKPVRRKAKKKHETKRKRSQVGKTPRAEGRKSGASRVAPKQRKSFPVKMVIALLLPIVTFAGIVWSLDRFEPYSQFESFVNKPIKRINIEGEFNRVSKQEVKMQVDRLISNTFLELDILALQSGIADHPWIDSVSVRRKWPDTLVIRVNEQRPIARWGEKHFLNSNGEIIASTETTELGHLPLLVGENRYAKNIMQQYLVFNKLMNENELKLNRVSLDNTWAWSVTLNNNIEIKLGRENSFDKLKKLTHVLQQDLIEEISKIKIIDMRYDNGFALTWVETNEDAPPYSTIGLSGTNQKQINPSS